MPQVQRVPLLCKQLKSGGHSERSGKLHRETTPSGHPTAKIQKTDLCHLQISFSDDLSEPGGTKAMFPTFTGSSRKGRNVNLSGQKAVNPFTSTSWAPGAAAGASKTVAHAQAERQHRQQERERLRAAQRIQSLWRGHRTRRTLRSFRRQIIDQLYSAEGPVDVEARTAEAAPLVLSVYQTSSQDDQQRLCGLARDLLQTKFAAFTSGAIEGHRLGKLARIVVAALGR